MNDKSLFYIPCPCGKVVTSHGRLAHCRDCGRWLDVSAWGEMPKEVKG